MDFNPLKWLIHIQMAASEHPVTLIWILYYISISGTYRWCYFAGSVACLCSFTDIFTMATVASQIFAFSALWNPKGIMSKAYFDLTCPAFWHCFCPRVLNSLQCAVAHRGWLCLSLLKLAWNVYHHQQRGLFLTEHYISSCVYPLGFKRAGQSLRVQTFLTRLSSSWSYMTQK